MDLGLDIGFGEVKAVVRNGDDISDFVFPSVYAGYTSSPMDAGTGMSIVDSGGRKYVVGADAKREKNQISPADLSDIIEAMEVYVAYLRRLSGVDDTANVVAGVPPCYWKQKEDYRIRLATMFGKVAVVPQGLGAARVLLDDLSPGTRHMVLDFGYNTVDHLMVEVSEGKEGKDIIVRRGGTWKSCGVTFLTDIFRGELGDSDLKGLRFHVLKEFLRNGQANFHGEIIDLSGAKRRAGNQYLRSLGSRIKDELGGELDHIDGIIAAGGGVYYLDVADLFKSLPVMVPENPELANAMGQMLLAE